MKKIFTALMVVTTMCAFAQITSNGTGGGDWNTASTWAGGTIPTSSDDVVVVSGDSVRLAAAGSCAKLTLNANAKLAFNAASLTMPGTSWDFNVNSTVYYNGTTTIATGPTYGNLYYMSANGGPGQNTTLNIAGNLNVTTATLRGIATTSGTNTINVSGNVVIGPGTGARISGANNSSATSASCTWNIAGNVSLTGNNSGNRIICYESAGPHTGSAVFNIDGDLNIGNACQVSLKSSTSTANNFPEGVINIKGNLVQNGLISILSVSSGTSPGLTINFVGTSNQTWSGSGTFDSRASFPINIKVNNSAGVTLANAKSLTSANSGTVNLTLVNGTFTTTNTNLLTVDVSGSISGGSSSSFVNGPMSHTWSTATVSKTYPLGKGSDYRPLEISLTTPASAVVRAEMFNADAGGTSALDKISKVRYYQTSLVSGTATSGGTAKITYGTDDGVSSHSTLEVAQSSTVNGTYSSIGRSASDASSVTSGTSYNPASGDFLILGSTGGNPLPVELTKFTVVANGSSVELQWTTATETNNAGFEIERTPLNPPSMRGDMGGVWSKVGFVEGAGTSSTVKNYSFSDKVSAGKYSYRLKQVDRNGEFTYSKTVEVITALTEIDFQLSQNYPNPFNPTTAFSFAMKNSEKVTVRVYNLIGEEVATLFNGIAQPNQLYSLKFDAKNLPSGVYFYALRSASRNEVRKMILNK